MNYFKSFFIRNYKNIIILFLAAFICLEYVYLGQTQECVNNCKDEIKIEKPQQTEEENEQTCNVDIKGQVKKPGVYQISCTSNINDAIETAGGKTKNAYTNNINLSKTIKDEMIIYIYSNSEIKKQLSSNKNIATNECSSKTIYINECIEEKSSVIETTNNDDYSLTNNTGEDPKQSQNGGLVNINSATKEQLMTLTGIGESKAISIIEYRSKNSFTVPEDIKNVSGIGDALYEKIKDNITV